MGNRNLTAARKAKNDEFYTRLEDIEDELRHYAKHFEGKTVLCDCDDPFESNFFKYFALNFNHLGLKRLVCTCYGGSPMAGGEFQPSLFADDADPITGRHRRAYKAVLTHVDDMTGDGGIGMEDVRGILDGEGNALSELHGDGVYGAGDFRSRECLDLLDEADIVVTNPPFSLFREYVKTLMDHGKKFAVIGNLNAVTYKEIFPLIRDGRLWPGYHFNKSLTFAMPEEYRSKTDERDRYGRKIGKVPGVCWYTNLDIDKRHEDLILYRRYKGHEDEYPKYDNYDAIEVSKVADIPEDYDGVMGVPITFLDKYNPQQFEIVGLIAGNIRGLAGIPTSTGKDGPYLNGRLKYGRILICRRDAWGTAWAIGN